MQKACREESCREDESLLPSSRSPGCRDLQVTFRAPRDLCKALRRWPALLLSSACGAAFLVVGFLVWPRQLRANDSDLWSVARADAQQEGGIRGRAPTVEDYCGKVEEDTEYHTEHHLYWIGNIANQDVCCAQCDAEPECAAWTYGRVQGVPGLSGHCYLKKLGEGEEPYKVERFGLVSGMLKHKLRKHGLVAEMLAKGASLRIHEEDREILQNETCPGQLNVSGYGTVSIVAAEWKLPGQKASRVEVPYQDWAVIPHLNGRAYFGYQCSVADTGKYDRMEYVTWKLLGKTMRYTTDLSKVGCGCNARLHLLPMHHNIKESKCHDFFCGHGWQRCGVSCAEIGVQDANEYAWSSNIHVHDDSGGPNSGYGGGVGWVGRRDWSDSQYGPGAECIDTTWPFHVEVHFPVKNGLLEAVEVTLTQEGHFCPLKLRLDKYHYKGRNGMIELTRILRAGVTPVISYWNSPDLAWMDGLGVDGKGPCVRDTPEACPSTVRFYDFVVGKGKDEGDHDVLDVALGMVHEHNRKDAKEARESVLERMKTREDCGTKCDSDLNLTGEVGPGPKEATRDVEKGDKEEGAEQWESYTESHDGNAEWEVVCDLMYVREKNTFASDVVGTKVKGEIIIGTRQGDWIKLKQNAGYVAIQKDSMPLLIERIVTYEKIIHGTCADAGMFPIEDPGSCEAAGFALGYFDTKVTMKWSDDERPQGCYMQNGQLYMSASQANKGNGVVDEMEPICASKVYPTTTTTTTTTTSTFTSTSTTTSTTTSSTTTSTSTTFTTTSSTTWGWPSFFCVEVVRVHGYELPLVKAQQTKRASIFQCEEYQVFSDGGKPQVIGVGPDGLDIMTIVIPPIKEAIGDLNNGATTNSWLNTQTFLQVWDLCNKDGRFKNHDWTVKVDPDAVFFPDRLREHMKPHTTKNAELFVMNCNRFNPVALYGSVEIFSKGALAKYLKGQWKCRKSLPWHGWGEDFFMSHCMDMLGVGRLYDFELLSDKRCFYRPCSDTSRVVYHDYKDASFSGTWFNCWRESLAR
uniref:Apple domain-containing protein n=1 Tax=Pyrodinium bahamense TaxID=73915 RepID=A0A7S0B3C1_9DINO|mmetsp:Transcript_48158/g.133820  ORF Transcript_48158/g.133820 Transcript_48158/m.133820 type:complete len:1026 (+) Transcript_48158:64-3141(+)